MSLDIPIDSGQFEHALLQSLFDDAPIGLGVFDRELRHVRANETLAQMNGRPAEELIGKTPSELHGELGEEAEALYRQVLESGVPLTGIEISGSTGPAPDEVHHWSLHFFPIKVDGATAGLCVLVLDITERVVLEERLEHRAFHDDLTGLPNRALVSDQLRRLLARRPPAPSLGVMFVDVDRFKDVNDEYGHAAGDEVLRSVARRLPDVVRPADVTGRWGGDEFVILVDNINEQQMSELAGRIDRGVCREVPIDAGAITPTVSVGATIASSGESPDRVIARADAAMYAHKRTRDV